MYTRSYGLPEGIAAAILAKGADYWSCSERVVVNPEAAACQSCARCPQVLAVESIRSLNGSVTFEAEIRYFLSSAAD